ncbi:MAG: ACP S-malonyltransferase [Clostridia bacterium]|nr:ACP S-malonyltransferase [Clostridia bacterium]
MKKVAFLFPGQGSQYVGMGKSLCENHVAAREVFDEASDALGFDIKNLCFEGSMEELTKTENTQPAILTASVAAFRVYMKELGVEPLYLAGHSLGEFSALACAEGIKFHDAVKIVRNRGRFMQEAVPQGLGAMAAVSGVDREVIESTCRQYSDMNRMVVVSNYNSSEQIVISGHTAAVNEAGEKLKQLGARVVPLKVSAPFHSPLMQPAADRLKEELLKYSYNSMKWDVIANSSALPYKNHESIVDSLTQQIVSPVRWAESMKYLEAMGVELAVELGPQTVLKNLMKKNVPAIEVLSYDKEEDVKALAGKLSREAGKKADIENARLLLITRCLAVAVCTKNSNWDNEVYKKGVIEPYNRIRNMRDELENSAVEPTEEQMHEALEMLKSVFETKRTPIEEQRERFSQIFDETGLEILFESFHKVKFD